MSFDSLPQINLGTAVLIIFVLCAGFVMLRGMLRMVIGTLVIGGSGALAWLVWRNSPVWLFEATGKSPEWAAPALAAATFLASWWLLGKMIRFFVRPSDPGKPASLLGALGRLVFALVPTSLLALVPAVFFHHDDAVAAGPSGSPKTVASASPMARLSGWLDETIPREWLEKLDPLANSSRVELAKAITEQAQAPRATVVDPSTGKPIPRAVIVQDPELQNLAREGKFSTLLRHPSLSKALADPKVRKLLHDSNP